MGANGTGTIDFGVFPGASDASAVITGQTGILAGSQIEAYIYPSATADHSSDEHLCETLRLLADPSTIVVGTGFTVRAFNSSQLDEPLAPTPLPTDNGAVGNAGQASTPNTAPSVGGIGTRLYGLWSFAWVWV